MNIKEIVAQMTLEEKAGLCSGLDMWHLKGVERLGVPSVMVTDGPNGLRKQEEGGDHLGLGKSVTAICYPTAASLASSYDRELVKEIGASMGAECQKENVAVILGPGANIKRSPLCGRNFEYFSEDPYLTGEIATSHIQGVQSQNVGTSLKHFCLNNQETARMMVDSRVDERTMREIYLPGFEKAVKDGKPWTVMCSYNRINGVFGCENKYTLTDILRDQWGFDGCVVTDWGAMDDKLESIKAGLELQMPGGNPAFDIKLIDAVNSGNLDIEILDRACERILGFIKKYVENKKADATVDYAKLHDIARIVEADSCVLLKNNGALPIADGKKVAIIGKFAKEPVFQGGGSSHINTWAVTSACDAFAERGNFTYSQGYDTVKDETDLEMLAEAVKAAKEADIAVVFAGMPAGFESEGFDRKHLNLPNCQNELISVIADQQPNTVVVLHNSSVVMMPWLGKVAGVIEAYLGGEAVGGAIFDILTGKVNPSGKLAETFPLRLEDNPSYLNFPGYDNVVNYAEGIFVGYRYYDKKNMDVMFPFGFGLSYTTFDYSNMRVSKSDIKDDEEIVIAVDIENTGSVFGKEAVQLYVSRRFEGIPRPVRELKGFEKVALNAGEKKTVIFRLNKRSFAYYDVDIKDWVVEEGVYRIEAAASSRDIRLSADVTVHPAKAELKKLTLNSPMTELFKDPIGLNFVNQMMAMFKPDTDKLEDNGMGSFGVNIAELMSGMPIRSLLNFSPQFTESDAQSLIDAINASR